MPPTLTDIPVPQGRGPDCIPYLEAHGIVPREPSIRSSDWDAFTTSPFQYYLTRRLGIVPGLSWSEALSRGSWFHTIFEHFLEDSTFLTALVTRLLDVRKAEMNGMADELGLKGEALAAVLDREEKDAFCALGWFLAARDVPILDNSGRSLGTIMSMFNKRDMPTVKLQDGKEAVEVQIIYKDTNWTQPLVPTLDRVLLDKKANTFWIVDYKTCSEPAKQRLKTCPIEFQTWLYVYVIQRMMEDGSLWHTFDLPPDVKFGGMMHIAIQKPTIDFCLKDRDYTMDMTPLKAGPNKGLPRNEKVYQGEPKLANYIKRCTSWYMGTGEYAHKEEDRILKCPVAISYTSSSILDDDLLDEMHFILETLETNATILPAPYNFPRNSKHLRVHGADKEHPYLPFYMTQPKDWPEIILRNGFLIQHRDESLTIPADGN